MKKLSVVFPLLLMMLFGCAALMAQEASTTASEAKATPPALEQEVAKKTFSIRSVLQQPAMLEKSIRRYETAMQYGDVNIAANTLYDMIAAEPKNRDLRYQLAGLYFSNRLYSNALLVSKDLLDNAPEAKEDKEQTQQLALLEMKAVSQNNLGLLEPALASYTQLLGKTYNPHFAYQVITLQYGLKQYEAAAKGIESMLTTPLDQQKVYVGSPKGQQEVPMKAALYNIKGVLQKEAYQDKLKAKSNFETALSIFPDFALAKNNLKAAIGD